MRSLSASAGWDRELAASGGGLDGLLDGLGPPRAPGGLWGHFPAVRLVLGAKGVPSDALPAHPELEALESVRESIGPDADSLLAVSQLRDGAWRILLVPKAQDRWRGRAALVRYARELARAGMLGMAARKAQRNGPPVDRGGPEG